MPLGRLPPSKLYRYSEVRWLDASLKAGEFRLRPASDYLLMEADRARQDNEMIRVRTSDRSNVRITLESGQEIHSTSDLTYTTTIQTDYFTLCFSEDWHDDQFKAFSGTDACLVIHHLQVFRERFFAAMENYLPDWGGADGPITYGGRSPLGAMFSKPIEFFPQFEWRFSWVPPQRTAKLEPMVIRIGDLRDIAEIRLRSAAVYE
jgi:hypothetical protein